MMKPSRPRRLLERTLVALFILAAQALHPAAAYASPQDPAWIPGLYDDADHDDVVLLVSSDSVGVVPSALDELRPRFFMVERLAHSGERAAPGPIASAIHSRAPPAR